MGTQSFVFSKSSKSTFNKQLLLFPPLSILVATNLFSLSTSKYLTWVGPFGTCILATGLSQCSSELQHVMRSAQLSKVGCDSATFVDPFVHRWIFSLGWNSWLQRQMCISVSPCSTYRGMTLSDHLAVAIFNFLRHPYWNVNNCTILQIYDICTRVPVFLFPH